LIDILAIPIFCYFDSTIRNILVLDFWCTNVSISVQSTLMGGITGLQSRHDYKFTVSDKTHLPVSTTVMYESCIDIMS
jgi:hypothetical protein